MEHLPQTSAEKYNRLENGPPLNTAIRALRSISECPFPVTLVLLLLDDILHLVI